MRPSASCLILQGRQWVPGNSVSHLSRIFVNGAENLVDSS